jgi:hypothetical protein
MKVTQYKVLYKLSDTLNYIPGEILPISIYESLPESIKTDRVEVYTLEIKEDELKYHDANYYKLELAKTEATKEAKKK